MQAYAKPHYLALGLTEDERLDNIDEHNIDDLEKLDPLRRALTLAKQAEEFDSTSGRTSHLDSNYKAIQVELDTFSYSILSQCKDMKDVETILEHRPVGIKTTLKQSNPMKAWWEGKTTLRQSNLMKALWEGRKDFVAHPYFQEYFNQQMAGNDDDDAVLLPYDIWCRAALWCLMYVPYALLLFCCYPVVVFADFFREADILFKKEEENKRCVTSASSDVETGRDGRDGKSSKVKKIFSFFRKKIHTPNFRMTVYLTIQVLYLTTMLLMMWNPTNDPTKNRKDGNTEVHLFHYIVLVVTAIFLIEGIVDFYITYREKEKAKVFESFWNVWSIFLRSFLLVGLSVYLFSSEQLASTEYKNRAFLSGNDTLNWSFTLICLGVAGEFFKTLQCLLLFRTFGPLVICVITVVKDALKTVPIYVIIFSSYGLFMWGMFNPFHQAFENNKEDIELKFDFADTDAAKSRDGLFHRLFWKILAADPNHSGVGLNKLNQTGNVTTPEATPSHDFAHVFILVAWAA